MFTEMANLRKNEETSRIGQKWLQEEDEELMKELIDKKTFKEIALNHKRTIGGIKSRIIRLIIYLQYKDKTKTIEELSLEYNIEYDLVLKYINKMEIKDSNEGNALDYINKMEIKDSNERNKKDNEEEYYKTNTKINIEFLYEKVISLDTKMLRIEQKLDKIITLIS